VNKANRIVLEAVEIQRQLDVYAAISSELYDCCGSLGSPHLTRALGRFQQSAYTELDLDLIAKRGRAMKEDLIQIDPSIMMGKPVVAGTRITVELILEKLAAGETTEQILAAHPRLTRDGIQAALAFAARVMRSDIIYPISNPEA
jgi:uncharacterized protein (DUF433 family)